MKNQTFIFSLATLSAATLSVSASAQTSPDISYEYDALGRLIRVEYGEEAGLSYEQYAYDAAGNRTSSTSFADNPMEGGSSVVEDKVIFLIPIGSGSIVLMLE